MLLRKILVGTGVELPFIFLLSHGFSRDVVPVPIKHSLILLPDLATAKVLNKHDDTAVSLGKRYV
jgi:hypothetical protein